MTEEKRRPSHRIVIQHDADNDKNQTEVGALWPHKQGGGFGLTIKRGISIASLQGVRLNAFAITDKPQGGDRGDRD